MVDLLHKKAPEIRFFLSFALMSGLAGCNSTTIYVDEQLKKACDGGENPASETYTMYKGDKVYAGSNSVFVESDGNGNYLYSSNISDADVKIENGVTYYYLGNGRWAQIESDKGSSSPKGTVPSVITFTEKCPVQK